jgi:hypothetical protein
MQIGNAASSPTLTQPAQIGKVATDSQAVSGTNAGTAPVSSPADGSSQDAAVRISPEGAAAAAKEASSGQSSASSQAGAVSNVAGDADDAGDAADAGDAGAAGDAADATNTDAASNSDSAAGSTDGDSDSSGNSADTSPLKSLAYGTLGLERPDQPQEDRDPFYTAGRWLAAGLTIGGIISLLA